MFKKQEKDQASLDAQFLEAVSEHKLLKARKLVEKGANIRAADSLGRTAFHRLAGNAYKEEKQDIDRFVCFLLDGGLDINARDNQGRTCLHSIAVNCKTKSWGVHLNCSPYGMAHVFINRGATVDAPDNDGNTPLHIAASLGRDSDYWGSEDMVELFLYHGHSAIAVRNEQGQYPHDKAEEGGHHTAKQTLKKLFDEYQSEEGKEPSGEGWILLKPDQVEHVEQTSGYSLTHVFNFRARVYTQIARNLETGQEALTVRGFDEFPDKTLFVEAQQELARLGGTVEAGAVYTRHAQVIGKPGF